MAATLLKQLTSLARQLLGKGLAALGKLLQRVPRARLVLWGACALLLAAWWYEHQARLRQSFELAQLQKQSATAVSALEARAAAAIRQANQRNAQAIHALEAQRATLVRNAGDLAARLQSLQERERAQAAQVAVLPVPELARRVAAELALQDSDLGDRGSGQATEEQGRNSKFEIRNSADVIQNPKSKIENPPSPALALSEPQLRNLAAALVERDACREQKQVVEGQFTNCRAQVGANAAIIQQQADSLAKLNEALAAKNEILTRREAQHQAELKAARGSRLSRLARVVECVAMGIVIGVVIR